MDKNVDILTEDWSDKVVETVHLSDPYVAYPNRDDAPSKSVYKEEHHA